MIYQLDNHGMVRRVGEDPWSDWTAKQSHGDFLAWRERSERPGVQGVSPWQECWSWTVSIGETCNENTSCGELQHGSSQVGQERGIPGLGMG